MLGIQATTRAKRRALGMDSRLVESAALTALGAAFAFAVSPTDPILLSEGFPWLALVPMLVGLIHGFVAALGSLAVLGLWALAVVRIDPSLVDLSAVDTRFVVGVILVGLVPAEFRDRFARESAMLRAKLTSADERFEALSRSYSLLRASHRNLERATTFGERSLVASFEVLRGQLRREAGPISVVIRGAEAVLSLFEAHGLVQSAAIFRFDQGRVASLPLATIGGATVDPSHPLIASAIAGRCVATVRELDPLSSGVADTSVLAAVPLVDSQRRVWGVVVILEMPFISLRDDQLRGLLSIGSSLADLFAEASEPKETQEDSTVRATPTQARALALASARWGDGQEVSRGRAN